MKNWKSFAFLLCAALLFPFQLVQALANQQTFGTKLLNGVDWLGGNGIDVYANSDGYISGDYSSPAVGMKWQCVELPQRLYNTLGWYGGTFAGVDYAYQIYGQAAGGALGNMQAHPNDGSYKPVPGDMIVHSNLDGGGAGHVAVVDSSESSVVHVVEQNASSTGRADYSWSTSGLSRSGAHILGIVHDLDNHFTNAPDPASRNPIGNFESLTSPGPGLIQMVGWGLDYDNGTGPADVLEEIDGTPNPRKADKPRADVGNAYPGYGNDHGFNDTLYASGGNHTVRVTVLNVGTGTANTVLGPRTVFVPYSVGEGAHNLPSGYSGPQAFLDAYTSYGGAGIIGLAENPVHMDPRNIAQIQDTRGGSYRRGLLVQRGAYPVLIVSGDARDYLESHFGGSVFDQMGYPRNNNHPWANGNLQDFDGGALGDVLLMKGNYVGQVFKVFGAIRQGYINNGGADSLGYPMSDEYACGDKVCQKFERKTIEWSGWTGIRVF